MSTQNGNFQPRQDSGPNTGLFEQFSDVCTSIRLHKNPLLREIIARVFNNHVFLRAHNPSVRGEMDEKDISSILLKIAQDIQMVRPSPPQPSSTAAHERGVAAMEHEFG